MGKEPWVPAPSRCVEGVTLGREAAERGGMLRGAHVGGSPAPVPPPGGGASSRPASETARSRASGLRLALTP